MKGIPTHTLEFIDSWLTLCEKWEDVPGFSVTISKDHTIIFDRTYGYANLESKEVLSTKHAYRIASQSKVFTATAILQLQEKKKLRIDDNVIDYLPWLAKHTDERWQLVTIRQLMSHGAGVIRDGAGDDFWGLRADFPTSEGLQELVLASSLVLEPNTKMKYSNIGYGLLGMVVESVNPDSYTTYINECIIKPLGLRNTHPELLEKMQLATGYSRLNSNRTRFAFPQLKTGALHAAAGFCSTTADLCRLYSALAIGSGKLLSDQSKREMQRTQWVVENAQGAEYALGLEKSKRAGNILIGHSGGFPGFLSRTWCDQANAMTVSVVATGRLVPAGAIAYSILDVIYEFGDTEPDQKILKFEQRFTTESTCVQVIATTKGLRKINPHGWWPMVTVDELEQVDDTTLKIGTVNGFLDEGELMKYTFSQDGTILHVKESDQLLVPSEDDELIPWW